MKNQLPKAETYLVKDTGLVKVHTLVSPGPMFANATHIIELPNELILIDGQFFAQYGQEFRQFADSLQKPITRFYVTHHHPDHYLGMGDAFADVNIYALEEIIASLAANAPRELKEKQSHMGDLIAEKLSLPTSIAEPCEEIIDGVKFIFERVLNTESPSTLVIKLPELKIAVVQDILYHNTHAFVTGPLNGWKAAIRNLRDDLNYEIFLPGHGKPADRSDLDNALAYLEQVEAVQSYASSAEQYKNDILNFYPSYAGAKLIDIYLPILYSNK